MAQLVRLRSTPGQSVVREPSAHVSINFVINLERTKLSLYLAYLTEHGQFRLHTSSLGGESVVSHKRTQSFAETYSPYGIRETELVEDSR